MKAKGSKKKQKNYADYPQLQFTTNPETKDFINKRLDSLREIYNQHLESNQLLFTKSDIAIEALKIGLKQLEKASMKLK